MTDAELESSGFNPLHQQERQHRELRSRCDSLMKISEAEIESLSRLEASSRSLERHTIHLKYLTIVLVILTGVLACQTYLLLKHP